MLERALRGEFGTLLDLRPGELQRYEIDAETAAMLRAAGYLE